MSKEELIKFLEDFMDGRWTGLAVTVDGDAITITRNATSES